MAHLLADISFHGYGHISQTAPALNELRRHRPDLRLTVRSAAPRELLAGHIEGPFQHIQRATDFGMVMESAVAVRVVESAAAYREFHHDWRHRVQAEAAELARLKPDLVLSNISYLALAGAQQAGIPALAMCSLNWADIFFPHCADQTGAEGIHAEMREAYQSALCFLKPQPSMPMPWLTNGRTIGPIARIGKDRRAELDARLELAPDTRLILASMGGFDTALPMSDWPRLSGVRWLVQASWQVRHPDVFALEQLDIPFIDLLRSCDVLLAKPGYGTFAEAGCNGKPMLYLGRGGWPEEQYLVAWLKASGRCLEVERGALLRGEVRDELDALFALPAPLPPMATGAGEAATVIAAFLG